MNSPASKPRARAVAFKKSRARNSFPIVGVGASAGGLQAFTQLLSHLPEITGMAFVLVQHLDPGHPSQLTSLLSRTTKIPVREIENGMVVTPDHIYVIPSNKKMTLKRGRLWLAPRRPSSMPHAVDHFFSSLAREQQGLAIGVILSGTGSDGVLGMKAIKSMGGITFAQDEGSAKFAGMPLEASAEAVDFILPPEKIAAELARIQRDPYLASALPTESECADSVGEQPYQRILELLRSQLGVDLSLYRDTTIRRRIQRRMLVKRRTLPEYVKLLEKDGPELGALFDDLLINVTSFFRDPEMFESLKMRVFPELLKAKPKIIRIWVTACSTGQEAYSIAMTLLEFLADKKNAPGIQIFATDINETVSVEKARRGFYPETIEAEVSAGRLRQFFTREGGGYRVAKSVRDLCVFARQNLMADPPFSRMDLVSCRNLLIYLTPPLQRQVVSAVHYALHPKGFLVLGNTETVGANSDLFAMVDRKHKIYSKKGAAMRPFSPFASQHLKVRTAVAGRQPPVPALAAVPADFRKEADQILLGRFAPASVLVNSQLEILHFRGRTHLYLEPPTGEASFNLLKMARENLSLELGTAIRESKKKNRRVRRNVRLHDHDTVRAVNLEIIPVKLAGQVESCFLILFEDALKGRGLARADEKKTAHREIPATARSQELKRLRAELAAARDHILAITEQHDAANEELRCANEEILSSNEELQSTNEQLGTAKEELQSSNEELQTLNEELQVNLGELNQTNLDLTNLLASVKIPILMFDRDLRIRRFNSEAATCPCLKPPRIGQSAAVLDLPRITPGLEDLFLEVIRKGKAFEKEIHDSENHWFSLRLHPYRLEGNRIEGVIMAVLDIDDLKRAHEKAMDYVKAMADTSRSPALVLRADLRINSANAAFYDHFGGSSADTENQPLHLLRNGLWNLPELRRQLSEILSRKSTLKDFEVRQDFPGLGRRTLVLNARRLEQKTRSEPMIYLSLEDTTDLENTQRLNHWITAVVESSDDAIISKDLNGMIISCNGGASRLFGYEIAELVGQSITMLIPPDHQDEETMILKRIRSGERIEHFETIRQKKDGSRFDVSLTVSPVKDTKGKIIGASKIARDIGDRKHAEQKLALSFQSEKEARQKAELAGRAKDAFLAILSHELRTPLNPALLIASEAAEDQTLPQAVRMNFETIRKNIELESRLIDDLLDLTRISSGKLLLTPRLLDVRVILQDAISNIQPDLNQKQIEIHLHFQEGAYEVQGDALRLQQIFWNVLKNAAKFTPVAGTITIEMLPAGGNLKIKISDTGIGMTPEELARIFEPFSQGNHSTSNPATFGGLGLGLSIARKLVELHSGQIHAGSEGPGQGSTITIELPLAKVSSETPASTTGSRLASSPKMGMTTGVSILLVEDHEPTRTALLSLLTRRHYQVFAASSVSEAREIAAREKINFVISDVGLADGSGNDLMAELRDGYGLKGIALTGYGMEEDVAQSLAAGFVSHLVKPVHVHALEDSLRLCLKLI